MLKKITFQSGDLTLCANLYIPKKKNKYGVLFLHGGGSATKERFQELQRRLLEKGFCSFAFDFRGVGQSQGEFINGSLQNRLLDAQAAFDTFSKYVPHIIVAGSSMGGHVAVRLTQTRHASAILLLYAAAYAKEAEECLLDDSFTNILRAENSWQDSPVFAVVEQFKGKILAIYGENDVIVPKGVQERFRQLVKDKGQFFLLANASHVFFTNPHNEREEQAKEEAFLRIEQFLQEVIHKTAK